MHVGKCVLTRRKGACEGADNLLQVFDVTNKYSFDCLDGWLDNFLRTTGKLPPQERGMSATNLRGKFAKHYSGREETIDAEEGEMVSLVVVGNKIDLKEGGMDHICEVTREMVRFIIMHLSQPWYPDAHWPVGGRMV